jgi:hypothetical protein
MSTYDVAAAAFRGPGGGPGEMGGENSGKWESNSVKSRGGRVSVKASGGENDIRELSAGGGVQKSSGTDIRDTETVAEGTETATGTGKGTGTGTGTGTGAGAGKGNKPIATATDIAAGTTTAISNATGTATSNRESRHLWQGAKQGVADPNNDKKGGSKFFVLDVYRTHLPRNFDPSIHDATNFDRKAETEEVLITLL